MDEQAEREFREYVAARQAHLFRIAMLLAGHRQDAEDLLQTALAKLALHWKTASRAGNPDAYVRRIIYNQQVSWWRTRRRRHEYSTADLPDRPARDEWSDPSASALRLALARALAELTRRQRAVIVLRYYEDLPEGEVARILGCSVGTVRSQTHRTLRRLREIRPELASLREA